MATRSLPALAGEQPDGSSVPVDGNDDFFGIRDYRPGDSRKRIHWKSLATGQSLSSKVYTAYADRSVWLDWEQFPAPNPEQRKRAPERPFFPKRSVSIQHSRDANS